MGGPSQTRDTSARKGLPVAGPGHEGLALSPDAPQKTPQTIPSYLAKAHFFQSSKTPTTEGRGSYGRRKRTSRGGRGGGARQSLRPAGARTSALGGGRRPDQAPRAPADLLPPPGPPRSVHRPRAGPSVPWEDGPSWEPRRGHSSPRLESARAAPARPPAQRPDQWKRLNLKVPPNSPPTPHVHCCHGNAHPEPTLAPTVWTHTYTRENYTDRVPAQ